MNHKCRETSPTKLPNCLTRNLSSFPAYRGWRCSFSGCVGCRRRWRVPPKSRKWAQNTQNWAKIEAKFAQHNSWSIHFFLCWQLCVSKSRFAPALASRTDFRAPQRARKYRAEQRSNNNGVKVWCTSSATGLPAYTNTAYSDNLLTVTFCLQWQFLGQNLVLLIY